MTNARTEPMVIEVFRPGRHTSMSGAEVSFSASDLDAVASGYDPGEHDAPVVVGHPKHDAPAYGWVKDLKFDGRTLKAELDKVDPAFAELVRAGRYRRVSASFYAPNSPANPKPGGYYLRHVGFLGAQPPAVKGLKPVEFGEVEEGILDFGETPESEIERLRAENAALRAEKDNAADTISKARRIQDQAFLESLVAQGKPLPLAKAKLLDFMEHLDEGEILEFAECDGGPVGMKALFMNLLTNLPKQVEFAELAPADEWGDEPGLAEKSARRITEHVETERLKGRNISFSEAAAEIL